jgi:signal transduction histidine kinase
VVGADWLDKEAEAWWRLLALPSCAAAARAASMLAEPVTQPIPETRRLQETVRQLQGLRQALLELSAAQDLPTLLASVMRQARELVGARGAEICLFEGGEKPKLARAEVPWAPIEKAGQAAGAVSAHSLAHDYITMTGETLVVEDYTRWVSGQARTGGETLNAGRPTIATLAAAGVPLKIKDEVLGVLLVVDNRPGKDFQPTDVNLLELLAPQTAIALRNTRLIQELQERSQAQNLAESRLVRSARLAAVGEMAAGVAHELNNPLTTVTGFVELSLKELPPGLPQRADLELALKEALRARSVVRRLLDFSRPGQDQRALTDINELISEVLTLIRHLLRSGGITLRMELWDAIPQVAVDAGQIQQVLHNLMQNAIQAMPDGGTLTVRTGPSERAGQRWIRIDVGDTGVGIAPENLERIFEPFFSARPGNNSGTGLGLSVSYGIIKSHDGLIEVESKPGAGSLFSVYLPAAGSGRKPETADIQG